jgi:DNA-binding transcriptional MerR regulator
MKNMNDNTNINAFVGQRSIKAASELTKQLNLKTFIGTDTGLPYRTLNHWENEGLYESQREENQRWRRFSFVEFVWIRMIDQMRTIGLKIDTIRQLKTELLTPTPLSELWVLMYTLGDMQKVLGGKLTDADQADFKAFFTKVFSEPKEGESEEFVTLLQLLIAHVIVKRCPIILVVFPDETFFWLEEHTEFVIPPEYKNRLSFEPHVRISITGIIKEFLIGDLAIERIDNLGILDGNETFLLQQIHSGDYESIKINFRDQKMDSLELTKSVETTKRIVDILAEADYQDIAIIQHKGRITRFENTVKHRFQNTER